MAIFGTDVEISPALPGSPEARAVLTVEAAARGHGLTRVRLDTRVELTEARRLYARHGYQPAAPFNDGWADLWFEKGLA
jgi:ribosomal protein S18 acetylase RimI-like enzyme